jgi:hypothetical protein
MAYIYPAPGVAGKQVVVTLTDSAGTLTGNIVVPALQDITINGSNEIFSWQTLDAASQRQIATIAVNSVDMNLVVDPDTFFGTGGSTTVGNVGIFGLSTRKTKVGFSIYLGDNDAGANTKTVSGNAYITGLAPTVSADAPVWVSPITFTVDGDYTIA